MNENAINFWETINERFYSEEIQQWINQLRSGNGEWFRNYGFVQNAIARNCRIGRIGFDNEKYEQGKAWAEIQLKNCGIPLGSMQN